MKEAADEAARERRMKERADEAGRIAAQLADKARDEGELHGHPFPLYFRRDDGNDLDIVLFEIEEQWFIDGVKDRSRDRMENWLIRQARALRGLGEYRGSQSLIRSRVWRLKDRLRVFRHREHIWHRTNYPLGVYGVYHEIHHCTSRGD